MKKKILLILFFTGLLGWIYLSTPNNINTFGSTELENETIAGTDSFSFQKGDILVRPNFKWLPGSQQIDAGRMFGHAAIVTENVSGKTVEEALEKATIIEAVVFDQKTRSFIFDKTEQVRETKAIVSFGPRFTGIRYRLRIKLTDEQTKRILFFLRNQMEGDYSIFSAKKFEGADSIQNNSSWHCASIVWQAYYQASGIDIDANKGLIVYPADIISSDCFNIDGGRIRF